MASSPRTIRRLALCASICILTGVDALTAACTAQLDTHGDHVDSDRIAQIRPGVQTREDVGQLLGSPSSKSVFDDERWYYISDVVETRSIFDREVKQRQVVAIRFDREGVVSEVDDFGLERGREVEVVARETPSFGELVGFLSSGHGQPRPFQQRRVGRTTTTPRPAFSV